MLTSLCGERRRDLGDRRTFSSTTLYYGLRYGRRRSARRAPGSNGYYSDTPPPALLLAAMAVFYFSLVDAALTLQLLQRGVTELNPVMRYLIDDAPSWFVAGKAVLTGSCLLTLLFFRDFRLGRHLRVVWLLYGALAGYTALITYELVLFPLVS